MMRPIEDLCLDQRFSEKRGNPYAWRVYVIAKIRVMNETFAADFQFPSQFAQVHFDELPVCLHEVIKTENEIDRTVRNHRQRAAIIQITAHVGLSREAFTTRFDALIRFIDNPQLLAVILEIMRPSS